MLEIDKREQNTIKKSVLSLVESLQEEITKQKIQAEVFIGGSFAKGTLVRKEIYDIDIFVRFDWRIGPISEILGRIIKKVSLRKALPFKLLHGSRDYFQLKKGENIIFEVIPVYKIKRPHEARNVMDLSYFHVNYIRRKLRGDNLRKEVLLAKQFCQAQHIYGAESYIHGFSGYGLECLIVRYKSFLNMIKKLCKIKERIVLDPEKHYKNETEALLSLNESKLHSPIVLIDPTWKERNVLAALSQDTFKKFQNTVRRFLAAPSSDFFKIKKFNASDLIKAHSKDKESVHLQLSTDRQAGDIAGTKMKKFAKFLEHELSRFFNVLESEFVYVEGQRSDLYLLLKKKIRVIITGPPVNMKEDARAFENIHKNVLEKSGRLYAEHIISFSAKEFLNSFSKKQKKKLAEMGITSLKVIN